MPLLNVIAGIVIAQGQSIGARQLVHDLRLDGQIVRRIPLQGRGRPVEVVTADVLDLLECRGTRRIRKLSVLEAAVGAGIGRDAQREIILDERNIDRSVHLISITAALEGGPLRVGIDREVIRVGLRRDEPHRAAHGPRSIQRTLRSAQHFNAREIDHPRVQGQRHRQIVDVEPGRIGSLDAANRHAAGVHCAVIVAGAEGQVGNFVGVVDEALDARAFERDRGQRGNTHGNGLEILAPLLRGHDDFLHARIVIGGTPRRDQAEAGQQCRGRGESCICTHFNPLG